MTRRLALLIGNSTFNNIDTFPNLRTPANDARDFASVLEKYGDFEILNILVDATVETIKGAIDDLFKTAKQGDLALLYYSGHGYRDRNSHHYLIAKNSRSERLLSTGIQETFIHDAISNSDAQHRVIILDCCFSATVIEGRKSGGAESLSLEELKGEATAILASSGPRQDSFEGEDRNSLFTKFLLEGITTGEADQDEDDQISVDELFKYAEQKVRDIRPGQKPIQELNSYNGKIHIATNPRKKQYHLDKIKELLTEGFSNDELRDFCYYTPEFRQVYRKLPENPSQDDIIDKLLDYAQRQELFRVLLSWAETANPRQYKKHQPYFEFIPHFVGFTETQSTEDLPQSKIKLPSLANQTPKFPPKRILSGAMISIGVVTFMIFAMFNNSLFNLLFGTTSTPEIYIDQLHQSFELPGDAPGPETPIEVPLVAYTKGRITNYVDDWHVWYFVCKQIFPEESRRCVIKELYLDTSRQWEHSITIGDPANPNDNCETFEIYFVVVDNSMNLRLQDLKPEMGYSMLDNSFLDKKLRYVKRILANRNDDEKIPKCSSASP